MLSSVCRSNRPAGKVVGRVAVWKGQGFWKGRLRMNTFKEETPESRTNGEAVATVARSSEDLRTATGLPAKFEMKHANEQETRAEILREIARVELLRSEWVVRVRYCDQLLVHLASISESERK